MSTGAKRARAGKKGQNAGSGKVPQDGRGLWIDRELLRRHMNSVPKFVPSTDPGEQPDVSRYLELADALLEATDQRQNNG